MKSYPIHENLDTSFINLSALIKYLRRKHFAGSISLELGDYAAEIRFGENDDVTARENDRVSGRVGEGEEALQRILIRARQPGGVINVYRHLTENPAVFNDHATRREENSAAVQRDQTVPVSPLEKKSLPPQINPVADSPGHIPAKQNLSAPQIPFRLTNSVETKAKPGVLAPPEWQALLDLTGELLGTIDRSLAEDGLNFKTAFFKASAEIVQDYPFLHRGKGVVDYEQGKITMSEQISATVFVNGIMEILRRIMEKLGANPNFSEIYRRTVQEILALVHRRKSIYDKFSITAPLEKIIGA